MGTSTDRVLIAFTLPPNLWLSSILSCPCAPLSDRDPEAWMPTHRTVSEINFVQEQGLGLIASGT